MRGRLAAWCLRALWGAGGGAAVFLLLCAVGVVDPATLGPAPAEPAVPAALWTRPEEPPFRAAALSVEEVDRGGSVPAGVDGGVVTMKAPDGTLAWVSDLPLAADVGVSYDRPARNQALRSLEGYTVAAVSCLRDDALTRARPEMALRRESGAPWREEDGGGWLDPADPETLTYTVGLCRELAGLGFDEILLTHCRYPAGYDGPEDQDLVLETFCRRLRGSLADFPVRVSVVGERDQDPALLAVFDRVWAEKGDGAALGAFRPVELPETQRSAA